jgi:hypothetical protein
MSQDSASEVGGFFSRWSQRKQAVKQGVVLPEPRGTELAQALELKASHAQDEVPSQAAQEPVPVPTLDDVAQLTPESDFSSFVTQNVPTDIKNAALKKLFADPHFNIMDGLDIYIGDYNTPDPLPEGMLAKMVGAQFLGLVKAPEDVAQSTLSPADSIHPSDAPLPATAAGMAPLENDSVQHDHTHLRLQPDDAPSAPEAGPSAG